MAEKSKKLKTASEANARPLAMALLQERGGDPEGAGYAWEGTNSRLLRAVQQADFQDTKTGELFTRAPGITVVSEHDPYDRRLLPEPLVGPISRRYVQLCDRDEEPAPPSTFPPVEIEAYRIPGGPGERWKDEIHGVLLPADDDGDDCFVSYDRSAGELSFNYASHSDYTLRAPSLTNLQGESLKRAIFGFNEALRWLLEDNA